MVGVDFDEGQMKRLEEALASVGKSGAKSLSKEILTVLNKTGARAKSLAAKELQKHIPIGQKELKLNMKVDKAASGIANPFVKVNIKGTERFPIKRFKHSQNGGGVSWTGTGGNRKIPHAFIAPKVGSHVFARHGGKVPMTKGNYAGKMRQPIKKLYGPSIVVAALKNNTKPIVIKDMTPEFRREMDRRIRTHVRKAMGKY